VLVTSTPRFAAIQKCSKETRALEVGGAYANSLDPI
jgi:hypothetical protein